MRKGSSLFSSKRAKPGEYDVQSSPVAIGSSGSGRPAMLKVDYACRLGSLAVVTGWCTGPAKLTLRARGRELETSFTPGERPDVLRHLGLSEGKPGFTLMAECSSDSLTLGWEIDGTRGESKALELEDGATKSPGAKGVLDAAWAMLAGGETPHSSRWRDLVGKMPAATPSVPREKRGPEVARGFLEVFMTSGDEGPALVAGWEVHAPNCTVWLEDASGQTYSLERAFRRFRQDVYDAVRAEFGHLAGVAGFVVQLPRVDARGKLALKVLTQRGAQVLAELEGSPFPADLVAAARTILTLGVSIEELAARVPAVDEPLLAPLVERAQASWKGLPVQQHQLGKRSESPEVSIVVPLYGRADFVEHQLIEFCRDRWLRDHAEVLYVVDDPKLCDVLRRHAKSWHDLYQVPFTWLWGGTNRGFSGANNLGAQHARGKKLLFLNSDAFPRQPGWLESLTGVLDERPEIGAVGPRLLFADGSIQHAGMEFQQREDLGIWVNRHPGIGLDPSLDPHRSLAIVPAVTGACLAVRRADFDRVGGWDTGYLIGDFEDSDLCLKLRQAGLEIAYLPSVELTHLERQSFKLMGQDEFRTRVTIFNAVRHQTRWASYLQGTQPAANNPPSPGV